MDHQALKTRHRQERESHHPNLTLRVHRALSWLNRAEQADDVDGRDHQNGKISEFVT